MYNEITSVASIICIITLIGIFLGFGLLKIQGE
uniref:Cytochrome b6f complex subunit 7 n=1 Tax=Boldia erythrosiphon TaxID=74908 RepID=A0A1Y9TLX6_9RHOD|nr:cytochrome b6f complex subunit 7 [Boldia erythrosiphon]ARO90636.1 cytochrome b6f complex subunit 7 [Boldia erythrosiphon]